MIKELVLIGSSSEVAEELNKKIEDNKFKTHTISSKVNSKPTLLINDYFEDYEKISTYISKLKNPYVIFFNGYLRENRPNYYPTMGEIFETFKINFRTPLFLTLKIDKNNKNTKFIYISTIASVKPREKNYIYGISKSLLEKSVSGLEVDYLFLRFGKIKTKMSEKHSDPPFTLNKSEAASLILKSLDKEGIAYPKFGLKLVGSLIKIFPSNVLNFIEKNTLKITS